MGKKTLSQQKMIQTRSRITRSQSQLSNFDDVSRQSEKRITTQFYLEDSEESLSQTPSDNLCFYNFDQTSLQASNGGDSEQDDYLFSDNESTASFRYCNKSITKSQRSSKSLKYAKNGKPRSTRSIRTSNNFYEDEQENAENTTYDYNIMRFQNLKRKKTFRIYCFNEQDLNIPQKFQESIVQNIDRPDHLSSPFKIKFCQSRTNESDDDKESDNEQVENAIHHVHKSLLEAVEEEKAC